MAMQPDECATANFYSEMGREIVSYTMQNSHIGYRMGARSTQEGVIDCSGWVAEITLHVMACANQHYDKILYDLDAAAATLKAAAAPQVQRISEKTGLISAHDIHNANLLSGVLIGLRRPTGGAWAANRWNRISHVVIFAQVDGVSLVSQSAEGKGVHLMSYDQWLRRELDLGSMFYAANPFALTVDCAPSNEPQRIMAVAADQVKPSGKGLMGLDCK